ncbi:MAG: hypothetical protein ACRET1_00875 [Burkholderiales bacterium]
MDARCRGFHVRALFRFLNESGIRYGVLGDTRDYSYRIRGDVDIVVPVNVLAAMPQVLFRFCRVQRLQLVQLLGQERTAMYVVLAWTGNEDKPHFLAVDLCSDYRRHGIPVFAAEAALGGSRPALDAAGRRKGFPVPAPAIQFIYYLVKKIDKLRLDRRQGDYLTACWQQDAEGGEAQLQRFWPDDVALISRAAGSGDWLPVRSVLPALRATLHRSLPSSYRYRPRQWVRKMARVLRPNGLTVAITGADDCGGHRMIAEVLADMAPAFRDTWYANAPPAQPAHRGAPDMASPMQRRSRRGPEVSGISLVRLFFDHVVGHFVAARPRKVHSTLIISDRRYPDVLVNPQRYGYGGSAMLARPARKLMPRPDLCILLRAPANPPAPGAAEITRTEPLRRGDDYPAFFRGTHASVVNASQDVNHVARDIDRAILAYLARRMERRHAADPRSATLLAAKLPPFGDRRFRS